VDTDRVIKQPTKEINYSLVNFNLADDRYI